ncbi:hypothetical protein MLD38_002970 [Melastoma candidum]|uniref:Uncharacterized protein n=1 Tax=Melastoma candidum TaxID=119954 RepID=A0ACB9S477_9MYRT|nr:hypothetical protein MLD38_002970 [Melastoma candidum]
MMSSIFSSFDAICAESLLGWKPMRFSGDQNSILRKDDSHAVEKARKLEGGSVSPSDKARDVDSKRRQGDRQRRAPRFAPELDGVHCFETILPY